MIFDISTGVQTLTAAGVVTGSLDTHAMALPFTLCVDVSGLTAGAAARIAIEDTANSSAFSDAETVEVYDFVGQIGAGGVDIEQGLRSAVINVRFGATNTALRANLLSLTGTSPSLSVHAYLTQ